VPSVETASCTTNSMFGYVWAITLSMARRSDFPPLRTNMKIETSGRSVLVIAVVSVATWDGIWAWRLTSRLSDDELPSAIDRQDRAHGRPRQRPDSAGRRLLIGFRRAEYFGHHRRPRRTVPAEPERRRNAAGHAAVAH